MHVQTYLTPLTPGIGPYNLSSVTVSVSFNCFLNFLKIWELHFYYFIMFFDVPLSNVIEPSYLFRDIS